MSTQFCEKCGNKVSSMDSFCESCGNKLKINFLRNVPVIFVEHILNFITLRKLIVIISGLSIIGVGVFLYTTHIQLQETQREIAILKDSSTDAISAQNELIEQQSKDLAEQKEALEQSKEGEASLRAALSQVQNSQQLNTATTGLGISLIKEIAPSVVKIFCKADSYSGDVQQGSGMLVKTSAGDYRVRTNLHVVSPSDGSLSYCIVAVYPNYQSSTQYLLYESYGYKFYNSSLDIAYLTPEIINSNTTSFAGSKAQLALYARDEDSNDICKSLDIGDHLSIFGYPGIGGDTLTVTDGIVSGFEFDYGTRYIKTSAKIDHGNSGGVAVKDSGCVVGIPTFVQTGSVESIGRVMDLDYLFNITL